jgi:hypothetical protein
MGSPIITLVLVTEIVPQTSVIFNLVTWLLARDDFINISHYESFRSHIKMDLWETGMEGVDWIYLTVDRDQ